MASEPEGCAYCEGKREIHIFECVIQDITTFKAKKFLSLKSRYSKGFLPWAGGELDQPWRLLSYFEMYDRYVDAWERLWPEYFKSKEG